MHRAPLASSIVGFIVVFSPSLSNRSPFREDLSFAVVSAEGLPRALHPAEMNLLGARASPKRRLEFSAGRAAARVALERLTRNPQPVLRGPKGEPLWPEGMTGSIAHCGPCAVALVARRLVARAIGIDLERSGAVQEKNIADVICCPSELHWAGQDAGCCERLTMLFSAKESVFKAFYPMCRRLIEFTEVMLSWDPERELFRGRLLTNLSLELKSGYEFEVGCERGQNFVLSFVVLRAESEGHAQSPKRFVPGMPPQLQRLSITDEGFFR
jgi:4'-phosphopantetheinyl transferase EntD